METSIYYKEDIVNLFVIDSFDFEVWQDQIKMRYIFDSLFTNEEDMVFFSFRRDEDLTDDEILTRIKPQIINTFNKLGAYEVIFELDEHRYDSVAWLRVKDFSFDLFLDLWNCFYSCRFFIPVTDFSFQNFISFQKKIKCLDVYSKKLLGNNYSNFDCIKGLGGDYFLISYLKDYQLPDIGKLASEEIRLR